MTRLAHVLVCLVASVALGEAVAAPITFNTALPVGQGKFIVRGQFIASRSGDDPLSIGREFNTNSLVSVVAYGVSAKLALFGVLPYTNKELRVAGGPKRSNSGIGDTTLFGRYTLHQRDWPGRTLRVGGVAGIKAPTGDDDESDGLGRLPAGLQSGTGSWDAFVAGVVSYQRLDFGVDAQLSYRANTQANNFEAGDQIQLDASYQHRLWPGDISSDTRGFLYGVLEFNIIYRDNNKLAGQTDPDSGGTTVFITPGIQYAAKKVILEAAAQLPVVQNLNGSALESDFILRGGFRINF